MLQINFYPESDNPVFEKAAQEYQQIWNRDGEKIQTAIEKISGLKFKEHLINALTFGNVSYSVPLQLQSDITLENKKGTIVHELCHRLLVGNNVRFDFGYDHPSWNLEVHKQVDLILYDIWVELYGEEFAKKQIDHEISLWIGKDISPYKVAWGWILSKTKEERKAEFRSYING